MGAVRISFTAYANWEQCPRWWRDFVRSEVPTSLSGTYEYYKTLEAACARNNVKMIDGEDIEDLEYLEFETQEDYLAFVLRYGNER